MLTVTADVREIDRLAASIAARLYPASELGDLSQELAETSQRQTQRRFSQRRAPDGSRWPARKDKKPHPLLEESGRLRRSVVEQGVSAGGFELRTQGVEYGAVHQYGWRARRIPPRPFLGFGAGDHEELVYVGDDWLERHVRRTLR